MVCRSWFDVSLANEEIPSAKRGSESQIKKGRIYKLSVA